MAMPSAIFAMILVDKEWYRKSGHAQGFSGDSDCAAKRSDDCLMKEGNEPAELERASPSGAAKPSSLASLHPQEAKQELPTALQSAVVLGLLP